MWYIYSKNKSKHQKFLDKHGIKPEKTGLGFSEKEKKWYGWSHRAIFGFGIGSKVKDGDCCASKLPVGFKAKTLDDAKKNGRNFCRICELKNVV